MGLSLFQSVHILPRWELVNFFKNLYLDKVLSLVLDPKGYPALWGEELFKTPFEKMLIWALLVWN